MKEGRRLASPLSFNLLRPRGGDIRPDLITAITYSNLPSYDLMTTAQRNDKEYIGPVSTHHSSDHVNCIA